MGRVLSFEKRKTRTPTLSLIGGRQHGCFAVIASEQSVLRSLKTPRTLRNNMHENQEIYGAPRPERERRRSAKAQSHKADAHALEESDRAIV